MTSTPGSALKKCLQGWSDINFFRRVRHLGWAFPGGRQSFHKKIINSIDKKRGFRYATSSWSILGSVFSPNHGKKSSGLQTYGDFL